MEREEDRLTYEEFKKRLWLTLGVIIVGVIVFLMIFLAAHAILMAFIGVVLALGFGGMAELLARHSRLPRNAALAIVLLLIVAAIAAFVVLAGPQVGSQFNALVEQLPSTTEPITEWLNQFAWGQTLVEQLPGREQTLQFLLGGSLTSSATRFISSLVGLITGAILVLFLGVYLAFQAGNYISGLLHLFPLPSRDRMEEVFYAIGVKLKGWMAGRGIAMVIVGILTAIGLSLLGIPLAVALGVLAGVLTVIPNWGPTAAAIPAALLALTQSPQQALLVVGLYIGVQLLLQYVINPLILRHHTNLPAAVVIVLQVLMTVLFGVLGLLAAAPLAAVLTVAVKMLYVEDVLGDDVPVEATAAG
ncbi:MAG: AI-2E family transporter [Chloroflexi bacterium]|nr:AI-2E family transporter [Chloroflexota bacterium]